MGFDLEASIMRKRETLISKVTRLYPYPWSIFWVLYAFFYRLYKTILHDLYNKTKESNINWSPQFPILHHSLHLHSRLYWCVNFLPESLAWYSHGLEGSSWTQPWNCSGLFVGYHLSVKLCLLHEEQCGSTTYYEILFAIWNSTYLALLMRKKGVQLTQSLPPGVAGSIRRENNHTGSIASPIHSQKVGPPRLYWRVRRSAWTRNTRSLWDECIYKRVKRI